jgi:hypothetical protein
MTRSSSTRSTAVISFLAALGAVLLVVGAALVYPPAGFIVAGVAALSAAYVVRFLEVQSAST